MTKETRETGDPLAALDRALADGGNRRSPLKQAMLDDYDRMAAKLKGKRPNWQRVTEEFMRAGFRNMDGGDLDPENVRVMWYEVRQMKGGGLRASGGKSAATPLPTPVAAQTRPVVSASSGKDDGATVDDPLAAVRAELNKRSGR